MLFLKNSIFVNGILFSCLLQSGNWIACALTNSTGVFHEYVRTKAHMHVEGSRENADDHTYAPAIEVDFDAFVRASKPDDAFDIVTFLGDSFRPSSVDPERLFSLARISKTYLQNRLSPAHYRKPIWNF